MNGRTIPDSGVAREVTDQCLEINGFNRCYIFETASMRRLFKKPIVQLSLDKEDAVAVVEYAVIVGPVVGGLLVWHMNKCP
jgi:hypothetical protein